MSKPKDLRNLDGNAVFAMNDGCKVIALTVKSFGHNSLFRLFELSISFQKT
jgi:hypothetical protein